MVSRNGIVNVPIGYIYIYNMYICIYIYLHYIYIYYIIHILNIVHMFAVIEKVNNQHIALYFTVGICKNEGHKLELTASTTREKVGLPGGGG